MSDEAAGQTYFSSAGRDFEKEEEIQLVSVGVDIGSATSHLVFSRIVMERSDNRYIVSKREVLHESEVLLTPYADDMTIDAAMLGTFIERQYQLAGLTPAEIDTGALILTGVAVRRSNARAIGDLFAGQAGKFVAVSAGDSLETMLVAYGSGAVALSARTGLRIMNVDIGGGTSKIAVCAGGEIVDLTVIDVGARIICLDKNGHIARIEEAGRHFAAEAGVAIRPGDIPSKEALQKIVGIMAYSLFQAMGAATLEDKTKALLRLAPLKEAIPPDVITFSGGVSEYIYGREKINYGDLGPVLAAAVKTRLKNWGPRLETGTESIRATVVGASQYTLQVSGNTIFVQPQGTLPLRNVPVLTPDLLLDTDVLDVQAIAGAIDTMLGRLELQEANQTVAVYFRWAGSATYSRLDAFCHGIIDGLKPILSKGMPLVLVSEGDVGGLIGLHCFEVCRLQNPVVSIDGIMLKAFDFIDIGALLDASGAVPVVIKSLVFPASAHLGRSDL